MRVKFAVCVDELVSFIVPVVVFDPALDTEPVAVAVVVFELISDRDDELEAVPVFEEDIDAVVVLVINIVLDCLADFVSDEDPDEVLEGFTERVIEGEALLVFDRATVLVFVELEEGVLELEDEDDVVFVEVVVFVAVEDPVGVLLTKLL